MRFRTVVIEGKARCSYNCGYLVCRSEGKTTKIHLADIYSIVIENNQTYISAYLLQELSKHKICCIICDEFHNPIGQYLPLYGNFYTVLRSQEQINWTEPQKKRVWKRIIELKIFNQAQVLSFTGIDASVKLFEKSDNVKSGDSTFMESTAASIYFSSLFGEEFSRKQENDINAALNYGYAILLSMCNREIIAEGYSTIFGIHHKNQKNYFNLACDFMEPFRPIVDLLVLNKLGEKFNKDFKRYLQDLSNLNIEYKNGTYKFKSVVSSFIRRCFDVLNKSRDVKEILNFDFTCINQG